MVDISTLDDGSPAVSRNTAPAVLATSPVVQRIHELQRSAEHHEQLAATVRRQIVQLTYQLVAAGWSQSDVARAMGRSVARVNQIVAAARGNLGGPT